MDTSDQFIQDLVHQMNRISLLANGQQFLDPQDGRMTCTVNLMMMPDPSFQVKITFSEQT